MRLVKGIQPLGVTTHRAMCMIETRGTTYGVQYRMVHGSDLESLVDEEFLLETTTTTVPLLTIISVSIAASPPPPTVTATPPMHQLLRRI